MKKYINNELNCANKLYEQSKNDDIKSTIDELNKLNNDLFKYKDHSFESDLLSNIINIKLNDSTYNFIIYLLNLYSSVPQLETETSTKYPIVRKQIISDNYIYEFANRVLKCEKFTKPFTFSPKTLHIFENNSSIFKKSDSRCIVYRNYYTKNATILLNKYNSIRDLVHPLRKFIEVIEYNEGINFSNKTLIIEYYMQHKAIQELINRGNNDAKKYLLTIIDTMVYNARLLKKSVTNKNWKNLPSSTIFKLLDFTNHAISIELINNNISLNELYTELQSLSNDEYINISQISIENSSLKNNIDNYVKKYIKKQYF